MAEVKCPTCGKVIRWSHDNAARPFCSERCKLIDLGAWASDRYSICGGPAADDDGARADTEKPR